MYEHLHASAAGVRSKEGTSSLSWSAYGCGYLHSGCNCSSEQVPCEQPLSLISRTRTWAEFTGAMAVLFGIGPSCSALDALRPNESTLQCTSTDLSPS
jgi:hypothetical protein